MVTGSSYQPAGWLTLKYDTNGGLLWAQGLPGPFRDARRVAVDANDAIYVAGRMWLTNPSANTTHDSVLIKYSPGGATLWTAVFDDNSAVDEPYSLVLSSDGSRIGVAGISGNLFMALMYDSNGNRLWANTDNNVYAANDLAFGPGNVSYFATGTYFPQDPNPYQMAIVKFDAAGNQLSIKSYGVGDRTTRVRVDGQGNVVATGIDQAGYLDWITIKTDANGNLLWSRRYDGGRNNDEIPAMLVLDASDAVYVTGTGGPNPSMGNVSYLKGVIAKYDSSGAPRWAVCLGGRRALHRLRVHGFLEDRADAGRGLHRLQGHDRPARGRLQLPGAGRGVHGSFGPFEHGGGFCTSPQSSARRAQQPDGSDERRRRGPELAGQLDQREPVLHRALPGRGLQQLHGRGSERPEPGHLDGLQRRRGAELLLPRAGLEPGGRLFRVFQPRHHRHSRGTAGAPRRSQQPRWASARYEPAQADLDEQQCQPGWREDRAVHGLLLHQLHADRHRGGERNDLHQLGPGREHHLPVSSARLQLGRGLALFERGHGKNNATEVVDAPLNAAAG